MPDALEVDFLALAGEFEYPTIKITCVPADGLGGTRTLRREECAAIASALRTVQGTVTEIDAAARAIWDSTAGDCSKDCRWKITPVSDCWCQEQANDLAKLALTAAAAVRGKVPT